MILRKSKSAYTQMSEALITPGLCAYTVCCVTVSVIPLRYVFLSIKTQLINLIVVYYYEKPHTHRQISSQMSPHGKTSFIFSLLALHGDLSKRQLWSGGTEWQEVFQPAAKFINMHVVKTWDPVCICVCVLVSLCSVVPIVMLLAL